MGRTPGVKNIPKEIARPNIRVKKIRLTTALSAGVQLRPYRLYFKYSLAEFSKISGIELTMISHFEKGSGPLRTEVKSFRWTDTAERYCAALGIEEIILTLKPTT